MTTQTTNLYQLYDTEAQCVLGPVVADFRDAPAIRTFHEVLANDKTVPGQFPEHFNLMRLGEQDIETGMITAIEPITIATGKAWLEVRKNTQPAQ